MAEVVAGVWGTPRVTTVTVLAGFGVAEVGTGHRTAGRVPRFVSDGGR